MTTQPSSDSPKSKPTPVVQRVRWSRCIVGCVIGSMVGGLMGWLIDSALTSTPYAGVRIGVLVGGSFGGMIGGGTGWVGVEIMLSTLICSAGGGGVALALWNPGPDDFVTFIPAGIGGIVGAFIGLVVGLKLPAFLHRSRQQPAPDTEPDNPSK